MPNLAEKTVPLEALSSRQQRLVQRHVPLVELTLGRMDIWKRRSRSGREKCDFLQEGCLALAEAVRSHDPGRHGAFAAFAMARVRHAISLYRHEREGLIRVPFKTQRRRLARRRLHDDRHRPEHIPYVASWGDLSGDAGASRRNAEPSAVEPALTIGDMIRNRYDAALARAVDALKRSPWGNPDAHRLLARCHDERWTIPEAEMRTPIRQLAREMDCSLGRVTYAEERVRSLVAALLRRDPVFRALRRLARRRVGGWGHHLTAQELRRLARLKQGIA